MGGGIKPETFFEDFLRWFKYEETSFIHDERYKILELIETNIYIPLVKNFLLT